MLLKPHLEYTMPSFKKHLKIFLTTATVGAALVIGAADASAISNTGSLTTSAGSISINSSSGGNPTTGPSSGAWFNNNGVPPYMEDTRGNWYNYNTDALESSIMGPGNLGFPNQEVRSDGTLFDANPGPPCTQRYSNCYQGFESSLNRIPPEGEGYGVSGRCLGVRAWVVGRLVSAAATNPTDRYELIYAKRNFNLQQCTSAANADFQLSDLPCTSDGGTYRASVGYILNNEIWSTTLDDQNWVHWRNNNNFSYSGPTGPFSYNFQEVLVPAEYCPIVRPQDQTITVDAGERLSVDLSTGLSCDVPVGSTRSPECRLDRVNFAVDFAAHANIASLYSSNDSGRVAVDGLDAGTFRVPFNFVNSKGTRGTANLTVVVTDATPTPAPKTVTVQKGEVVSGDLLIGNECPADRTCTVDAPAFRAAFRAARTETASSASVPFSDIACLTTSTNARSCSSAASSSPSGGFYVFSSRWEGSFTVPFVVRTDTGESATSTLTVNITPNPPTPEDKTLDLKVGDTAVIDLWTSSDCPSYMSCTMDTNSLRTAFAANSGDTACIDGFEGEPCTARSLFADGRILVRGTAEGSFQVPFTIATNYGDANAAVLTVNVTSADIAPSPPLVTGELVITHPEVAYAAGSFRATELGAYIGRLNLTDCPSGYSCVLTPPSVASNGSRGYSLANIETITGIATVTLEGDYEFCSQPNSCDTPANTFRLAVSTSPTPFDVRFYHATRVDEPYLLGGSGTSSATLVAWQFIDICRSDATCVSQRFTTGTTDVPVPLSAVFDPVSNELPVIGPQLR